MMVETFPVQYYAVIFTSVRTALDHAGYQQAAQSMLERVQVQPGFLGVESVRGEEGLGITVSYWTSEAAILAWKNDPEHAAIREKGRSTWYRQCTTRVVKVERNYSSVLP
jgi:heme-degrading monooxygenase HmoA